MINLYELQAKYYKMIYVSSKVLRIIETEGIYWLDLALNDFFNGVHHEKRFWIEKKDEKIIIRLREENRNEKSY